MRRLTTAVRSALLHTGHAAALSLTALMAMAMAPSADPAAVDPVAMPAAPPVVAVAVSAGPMMREVAFGRPIKGFDVNSNYGMRRLPGEARARRHEGVDFAAPQGTSVFAVAEGTVLRTGRQPTGWGNFVELRHPNGMTTLYAHLSRIDVRSGDTLMAGERLGLVGSTGRSTGPHLHFEVKRDGRHVDPTRVMDRVFQAPVA